MIRSMYETNVFGAINATRTVLPTFAGRVAGA